MPEHAESGSLAIEPDEYCFVCGPENPSGLQARFTAGNGQAQGTFHPRSEHQGFAGISHGGILASLLDEAMVYAAVTLGRWVTTAELTVRYCRPARTGEPITISAEVTRHQRRLVECRAELRSDAGEVVAYATGKLMQDRELRPEERRDRVERVAESVGENGDPAGQGHWVEKEACG